MLEPGDLHIDRQHAAGRGALPFVRHEAALGKQFEDAGHDPAFRLTHLTLPSRGEGPLPLRPEGRRGQFCTTVRADRNRALPVPAERGRATTEAAMDDGRRIVESPSRARQASKPGIVRYVLAI